MNLLPQGDFKNPGDNTGWAEGFNIPQNQEFQIVSEKGKSWLRIENHDAGRQLDYVHAYVRLTPEIESLAISVRMKATSLKVGAEGWHDARVAMSFEGSSSGYPAQVPELAADSDWVTKSEELKVPKGATRLNIQPAMFHCTGVFEIADLTVTPHLAETTQLADAELPTGVSLNWDKMSITTVNAKRAQVSLDGIWHFIPAAEGTAEAPKVGWAYIKVPGSWQSSRGRSADFVARGGGPQWDLYDGARVARAWYQRQVPIPAEWRDRAISLRFDRVCTDAIVYVNGTECGRVAWPWGSVDITSAVTPGQTADVRVLVAAIADAEQVGTFWQNAFMNVSYSAASLRSRGLTGSVFLESCCSEARVSDVFVRTSTRKKEVSLDVELTGVKQAGEIHLVADMLNEKGVLEKSFTADATVEAKATQALALSWPWADPRLWDVGQPNLYTLRLKVTGAGLEDEYNQKFGFREFWIEGRQFYLNGTVIHLRQPCFYNGPRMQMGDTFSEMGAENVDTRGDAIDSGRNLDDADRKGYLVAQYILNANKHMLNSRGQLVWEQNQQRAFDRAAVWMRHYRNHPSVVMWIAGFNFFNSAVDADPRHVGRRGWGQSDERWQHLMVFSKEMFDGLKQLDSTRVYYSHSGAFTGDAYTMNSYLDLIPLQEREEWLSAWGEGGEMPISMVEFGTPMDCTYRRGRHGFESNITSEPLLTEFAAIYFGTEAYSSEEPKYRQFLHDLFRSGMLYESSENRLDEFANNHKIQQLYRINTWRSWRTAGLPGGLRTWSWMQDALKEINGPTLAWIAGPAGAYTAKDHHFSPGQKIDKQIVLINDTRQPQNFTAAWAATVGGKEVHKGQIQGSLAVSEIRFIPFQVIAPAEKAGGEADGQITLAATIGEAKHQDTFAFRVLGEDMPEGEEIAIVDPNGTTSKMLANLGYRTRSWNGAAAPLVVIGRNALKGNPPVAARLEPYVRAGSRALVCAQDPEWITRALGWRVCPKVARRVFPVHSATLHSPFYTLHSEDLRDWTGSSTLIEAYPEYVGDYLRGNEREQPYAGWHWGNRGGVSSAAIEKPHRSGWRPLLECEFDLAYTPLMELDYGQGRLIVCTLDLEDHVVGDPAAKRTAGRIIDYALHSPLSPQASKVVYLGGATGAAWLDKIGVTYQTSATMAGAADTTDAGLLLIGPDATLDPAALTACLERGGKAFFLPRSQPEGCLGATLKQAEAKFAGSLSVPDWPEARGLSASDLRWRCYLDTPPWVLSAGVEVGADGLLGRKAVGKGVAVFCQVDPECFHADEKTYFRYTRWRATRTVAQLLANLGASFAVDSRIFHPLDTSALKPSSSVGPNGDRSGPQATKPRVGLEMSLSAKPEGPQSLTYYHPDYRTDFPMGDNPYRYYRW
ncbi:MAG: sugar-binding domain-containing protein [Limisphaerales bacterium]